MSQIVKLNALLPLGLLLNRLALGTYFVLAGVSKVQDVSGFYHDKFVPMLPGWAPQTLMMPYGYSLPFLEIIVGAALILGLFGRLTAGVMTAMLISFTIALLAAGGFSSGPVPMHTNVVFITLAFLLTLTGSGAISVDQMLGSRKRRRH